MVQLVYSIPDNTLKNKSGVYFITNSVNDKVYVGSTYNFYKRWKRHVYELKNKTHANLKLQNNYSKYSDSVMAFQILEICDTNKRWRYLWI